MFKLGKKYTITMKENGVSDSVNVTVLDYDEGLIKIDHFGEVSIINTRSIAFIKAVEQK